MSLLKANCPSCAAPIEFKQGSSIVLICPFCRSAVARTDRNLEDLGKVAEIAESESPLRVGLKGIWNNNNFELTGRAQNRHQAGGVWDEWYATFSNGWVGWLAKAQGRFYLTFYRPLPENARLPSFDFLRLGQVVPQIPASTPLTVAEKGTATAIAAEGEIPYKLTPNEKSNYADLSGKNNVFATIDYSFDPPWVFLGEQVSLADLGLADVKPAEREARKVSAAAMRCPNCGGPLSLEVPDQAERVTCPNCDSLLDVNQGKLTWLKSLIKPKRDVPDFVLEIGQKGTFADEIEYKIIGAMTRSVSIEGIKYFWHEYLLYNPQIGYRWLVQSDNHWSFVESVNAGDVVSSGSTAGYGGKTFKIFQDAPATVEYVKGEFYWRVEQGETVRAVDYVAPPLMLSAESSADEINWSKGTYLTKREVEKAFNISNLPGTWTVAPNQPFTGGFYIKAGFAMLAVLCAVAILMIPLSGFGSTALSEQIILQPTVSQTTPQTVFSQPFEIRANRNVRITANAPVSNSWADLNVDLINEQNNEVESVNIPVEYYYGTDDGESWSEGGQTQDASLSALPAGKYTLRVEGTWEKFQQPMLVNVKVEQNVVRGVNFCFSFFLLSVLPFIALIRKVAFESRRWGDSMYNSNGTFKGVGTDNADE